jgi:hypothetical protein
MAIGELARRARADKGLEPRMSDTPEPTKALSIEDLVQALGKLQPQTGGITKDDLADVLKDNAEGMRRALKPENARHPDISALNPLGERDHPRPALTRKTYWVGIPLDEDELDGEEITLLNKFTHTKEAHNGLWKAEIRRNGSAEELWITFPSHSIDDRMDLPRSMKLMLAEIHGGKEAVDPMTLAARVAELEARLATP